jgi:tetratricopeptide (TPR) repeat protein
MDAGQAAELADRLASGDPGGTDSARRVLEARGGTAGTVLARKILELRARIAALEADLALQRDKAEKTLEALLRAEREQKASRDGLRADRFYQRGLLEQQSGHHDLAEKDYGEALAADPAHAGALHGRGVARFALGDLEGALDDFTRATAIRPEFAPSHLCRGRVLMSLKKAGEAEEAFDRVLALDPGNAEAREAKEEAGRRRGG